ncbi:MAG: hypothetical protein HOI53_02635 [Francisellaceae bacterium]|jgi:hypothetical protein|nr:hypothetical protein [Francisellaceae bacterium]MBT6206900.1 hypothetical protein [Francisellaceae bacterium]MBT6538271.1 hypothetical protein [Francisellaceae bacterium]
MISVHDKTILVLTVLGVTFALISMHVSPPVVMSKNNENELVYEKLSVFNGVGWYYDQFVELGDYELGYYRDKLEEKAPDSKNNIIKTVTGRLAKMSENAGTASSSKTDFSDVFTGGANMTPVQKELLKEISSAIEQITENKEEKKDETEDEQKAIIVEKENKQQVEQINELEERAKKQNKRKSIFRLKSRDDHSAQEIQNIPEKINLRAKKNLANTDDAYYDYNDSDAYYDYGTQNNYNDVNTDSYSTHPVSSNNSNQYNVPQSKNYNTNPKEQQIKKRLSEVSPEQKQEMLNNRKQYQQYEKYQSSSPEDYQKQMNEILNDSDQMESIFNDVTSQSMGKDIDPNSKINSINNTASSIDDEKIEGMMKNNKFFNGGSDSMYEEIMQDKYPDHGKE